MVPKAEMKSSESVQSTAVFNRWLIPVAAVAIHICIGSVYAWSTFNRPIKALFPNDPSWFSPPYTTFSTALVLLGLSAALGDPGWSVKVLGLPLLPRLFCLDRA